MTRIAFFEPSYTVQRASFWELRGNYKYPSLLGRLCDRAEVSLFMPAPPPKDDPFRLRLERECGVSFRTFETLDESGEGAVDDLIADYRREIRAYGIDIVSTLNGRPIGHNHALARAAQESGIDFVYRVAGDDIAVHIAVAEREDEPFLGTSLWAKRVAEERHAFAAARTIVAMSRSDAKRIAARLSDSTKIAVCHRGVDQAHFRPAKSSAQRCTRLLFLGRNRAEKGADIVEGIADRVAATHPDIRVTIAGEFEPRDEGNRRYRGFTSYADLADLYRDHDALLLPSRSEGFPQVVIEAMSCGLPVIVSRHLLGDDLGEERGALLVAADPEPVAETVRQLADDPGMFQTLRNAALAHARTHFEQDANRARYHEALLGEAG